MTYLSFRGGRVVLFYLTIILFTLPLPPLFAESAEMMERGTSIVYVDCSNTQGPWDGTIEHPYQHIQDGVDNAGYGGMVYVFKGIYYEHVFVDKSVRLFGEDKEKTIVDGMNSDSVFCVAGKGVNIENFTIRNSGGFKGDSAIKINTRSVTIANCIVYRSRTGVYINDTDYNHIRGCIFYTNGEGVFIDSSSYDKVDDCIFSHNALGLNIKEARNISVFKSFANNNGVGIYIEDSSNVNLTHSAFYDNNDNQGGVCIFDSNHVFMEDCNIYHNGFGVKLLHSSSVWIDRCNLTWNTHFAVIVDGSSTDITLFKCNISSNFRYGVYVRDGGHMIIHYSNICLNSLYGVFYENCSLDAQRNWWGSFFGPSATEMGFGDRVTQRNRFIQYFPWETKPVEAVGSGWRLNPEYGVYHAMNKPLLLEGKDSDGDMVPDWWEMEYGYDPFIWDDHVHLDPDNDGLNNIEECYTHEYNSNPFHKDLFLEFDWMGRFPGDTENKPASRYLDEMKMVFEQHNITLHVDDSSLGGGEEIPYVSNFSYADLRDLYWDYFLHNDLDNPRKGIFHYCIVCFYGPGPGFAFVGWDHLDSFDISAQMLQNKYGFLDRQRLIVGGSIHELGHTLGLFVDDHDGIDNMGDTKILSLEWWRYRNYRSCMNYLYTYRVIDYSDGSHGRGDFDDWGNLDFYFFKNSHFEWPK